MATTTTDPADLAVIESVPVRDDLIHTAIKFLENPNVKNTPLAQKQKFLQRKGLTDQEIQIACEKSGAYIHHDQNKLPPPSSPLSTTITSYNPYHRMQLSIFDRIRELLHNIATLSIVVYVIHKFYEKFIAPYLFGKKKKSMEETVVDLEKNTKSSLEELKEDLKNVKVEVQKINWVSENDTIRQLVELKSEVSSVKGLLLGRKQFPSVANSPVVPPSIPAWQMSSVPPDSNDDNDGDAEEETKEDLLDVGSGSGSSEPEHGMKTSESSLEIIYSSKDCDSESCHSRKSNKEDIDKSN